MLLIGCCRLLLKLGDDAGRVFIHRWMKGAIAEFIVVCLYVTILTFFGDESMMFYRGASFFNIMFVLVLPLCCVIYTLSGVFVLAESHPEWKTALIYVGLSLIFPYLIKFIAIGLWRYVAFTFERFFGFVTIAMMILMFIILKKIIFSEVFTPGSRNRVESAVQQPLVTPTMTGVFGSFCSCCYICNYFRSCFNFILEFCYGSFRPYFYT